MVQLSDREEEVLPALVWIEVTRVEEYAISI
jgi:hypothetical protein